MNKINFLLRISCAYRYHNFLSARLDSKWLQILDEIESNINFGLPEVMVLLHPKWHQELKISPSVDPRGQGQFSSASIRAKCRAEDLWGYKCPYDSAQIHIDHTFPFARGGATKDDNAMYLCKEHNLSKSTDLHSVPWEIFTEKIWIQDELKILTNMAQRLTTSKIYSPLEALKRL